MNASPLVESPDGSILGGERWESGPIEGIGHGGCLWGLPPFSLCFLVKSEEQCLISHLRSILTNRTRSSTCGLNSWKLSRSTIAQGDCSNERKLKPSPPHHHHDVFFCLHSGLISAELCTQCVVPECHTSALGHLYDVSLAGCPVQTS